MGIRFGSVVHCPVTLGDPTVRVAVPLILPRLAVIVVWPGVSPEDCPPETPATLGVEEFHVMPVASVSATPLRYVPTTLNFAFCPVVIKTVAGKTVIETS